MPASKLTDLTATEARDAMVKGEFTAEAYVRACLDAIDSREKEIEAWVVVDRERALEQARAADRQRASGAGCGALHGLPVGIKDIIDTADLPTQNGSPIWKGHQPAKDASAVAQIRAGGGVVIGKTVTTELANRTPNKTKNPHNPEHTPGGSSSGSAAAVGAKTIPLALGTQTGGSVIRPASFCGVHALKPTLGLISRTGVTMQSHTLDTIGVYGRSLADLALITDALSAHDPSDAVSYTRARPRIADVLAAGLPVKPRFAFYKTPAWNEADPAAQEALIAFVKRLGNDVDEIDIPAMADVVRHHANVHGGESSAYYGPLLERHPEGVSPILTGVLKTAAKVSAADYVRSVNARETIYAEVEKMLDTYTALITLPAPGPAPKGLGSTGNAVFNGMWTYLGVPCVTSPLMSVAGLPLGVQLVGKRRDEGRLLAAARWMEERGR